MCSAADDPTRHDTPVEDGLRAALIDAIDRVLPRGAFHETAGYVDALLAAIPDAALAAKPSEGERPAAPPSGAPPTYRHTDESVTESALSLINDPAWRAKADDPADNRASWTRLVRSIRLTAAPPSGAPVEGPEVEALLEKHMTQYDGLYREMSGASSPVDWTPTTVTSAEPPVESGLDAEQDEEAIRAWMRRYGIDTIYAGESFGGRTFTRTIRVPEGEQP